MTNRDAINYETIKAFLVALSNQQGSTDLQKYLNQIGKKILSDPALLDHPATLFNPVFEKFPEFDHTYLDARRQLDEARNKIPARIGSMESEKNIQERFEVKNRIKEVLNSKNSFRAARLKNLPRFWQKLSQYFSLFGGQ